MPRPDDIYAETPGRLVVVRHGATEWSRTGRHTGLTDLPLDPSGEREAVAAGERLAGLEPALVLTSPLQRAARTCELAGYAGKAEVSDLLVELDYGDYEGLTTKQIRADRPDWDLFSDGCPNGESVTDVASRADRLISRLRADARLRGADVLVFSHGHMLRVLAARWLELDPEQARRFTLGSGSIGKLAYEHEWTVIAAWNV